MDISGWGEVDTWNECFFSPSRAAILLRAFAKPAFSSATSSSCSLHLSSKVATLQIRLESSRLSIARCAADLGVEPSSNLSLEEVSKLRMAARSDQAS